MKILFLKLKRLKLILKAFYLKKYGDLAGRLKNTRAKLEIIQLLIINGASTGQLLEQEKFISLELQDLVWAEESFYRQKARVSWVREGDSNTSFFHSIVRLKQNKQSIKSIFNDQGKSLHTYDQIAEEVVGFFIKLLDVSNPSVSGCSIELLQDLLCSFFSDEACNAFQSELDMEEFVAY
ncbi:hypothetical protein V6N13_055629 [Hibiscus sabdariffa]